MRGWATNRRTGKGFKFARETLMVARFFRIRSSEMSLAALRVNMVSLQRLPMLRMRHWMDVDGARFSLRKGRTHVQCLLLICVHGGQVVQIGSTPFSTSLALGSIISECLCSNKNRNLFIRFWGSLLFFQFLYNNREAQQFWTII